MGIDVWLFCWLVECKFMYVYVCHVLTLPASIALHMYVPCVQDFSWSVKTEGPWIRSTLIKKRKKQSHLMSLVSMSLSHFLTLLDRSHFQILWKS